MTKNHPQPQTNHPVNKPAEHRTGPPGNKTLQKKPVNDSKEKTRWPSEGGKN